MLGYGPSSSRLEERSIEKSKTPWKVVPQLRTFGFDSFPSKKSVDSQSINIISSYHSTPHTHSRLFISLRLPQFLFEFSSSSFRTLACTVWCFSVWFLFEKTKEFEEECVMKEKRNETTMLIQMDTEVSKVQGCD